MVNQQHLRAVNRLVTALNLDESGVHAAVVQLARATARRFDQKPSSRNLLLHRSVLKDLPSWAPPAGQVLYMKPAAKGGADSIVTQLSPLARCRV